MLLLEIAKLLIPPDDRMTIFAGLCHLSIAPGFAQSGFYVAVEKVRESLPSSCYEVSAYRNKPEVANLRRNNRVPFALLATALKLLGFDFSEAGSCPGSKLRHQLIAAVATLELLAATAGAGFVPTDPSHSGRPPDEQAGPILKHGRW
ncbi:hypothetical protein [Luteibacter sp. ME-Dv--P-043b]|uniref:hypothetical protein n=1 Tax=Luteibacter sp. ME-Dv--P-043b TaxID=3040291 RepID=UPI002552927E|nr:hypothetical protein [Luteibacter sp. ME-Dv--P-043b]